MQDEDEDETRNQEEPHNAELRVASSDKPDGYPCGTVYPTLFGNPFNFIYLFRSIHLLII